MLLTPQDYHAFFPSFVWVVRDFSLQLLEGGREITPNEYLEGALKPQGGFSEKAAAKNQVRRRRHTPGIYLLDPSGPSLAAPCFFSAHVRTLLSHF